VSFDSVAGAASRVRQGYETFASLVLPLTKHALSNQAALFEVFGGGTSVVDPILGEASATLFLDSFSPRTPVDLALTSIKKSRDSSHRSSLISCCIRSNRRSTARSFRQARITTIRNAKIKKITKYSGSITRHPVTCKRAGRPEDMWQDRISAGSLLPFTEAYCKPDDPAHPLVWFSCSRGDLNR
jgi:hypothetical protein